MKPGNGFKNKKSLLKGSAIFLLLVISFCSFFSPVAFAEPSAPPEQIILAWTGEPVTSQTITWLLPDNATAQVQYLGAEGFNGSFDGAQQIAASGTAFDSAHYRYTTTITGLTPGTEYVYRVGREGSWSEALTFNTAVQGGEFSFLYMGDVQSGYAEWGTMLNSVYQGYPQIKFAILGGDLTDNGGDETEWGQFLDAATGVFARIPVMPAMGNHDGFMYLNFFELPDNGPEGLKQKYYSFDYGDAHFVVLNSSSNTDEGGKQWLQQDLQATSKQWKFVVFHIPAYPATYDYKEIDKSIRANWVPILEQSGVDMVFVGHQHEYMRTHPVYQGEVQTTPAYGIVYVMGNAGSKTYAGGGGFPYIAVEQTGSNYQLINIDGNLLTLTSKQSTGELIDYYTINKGAISAPALTADVTDNVVGQAIELTFAEDADWRAAINVVHVDGEALPTDKYTVSEGKIIIDRSIFTEAKGYAIIIKATGYQDAAVTQTINSTPATNPLYVLTVQPDAAYYAGSTPDGINTMTVNTGMTGLKYFAIGIAPVNAHIGDETVVFTHLRNGIQIGLNATRADFDQAQTAQAGFNVQQGDMVKVYIVDNLTNAVDFNPTLLQ